MNRLLAYEFLMNLIRQNTFQTLESDKANYFISFLSIAIKFSTKREQM